MKTENGEPENIDDILKEYQALTSQKDKAKKTYQKYRDEWLKFREKYKAVLQASLVKADKNKPCC